MSRITIPVHAYVLTLRLQSFEVVERPVQVGRTTRMQRERRTRTRDVGPRHTEESVARAMGIANQIWSAANIVFDLRSTTAATVDGPGNREEVDQAGFFALASAHPARDGVSALFVSRFENRDLGGQAAEALRVCICAYLGDPLTGKTLAHEFGHLLGLPHVEAGGSAFRNLMYPALRSADELTDEQKERARNSNLVRWAYQQASQAAGG